MMGEPPLYYTSEFREDQSSPTCVALVKVSTFLILVGLAGIAAALTFNVVDIRLTPT